MLYNDSVASTFHAQRQQRMILQAWREQAAGVRYQVVSLQAAMLRWSHRNLASAFAAWAEHAADQARPLLFPVLPGISISKKVRHEQAKKKILSKKSSPNSF